MPPVQLAFHSSLPCRTLSATVVKPLTSSRRPLRSVHPSRRPTRISTHARHDPPSSIPKPDLSTIATEESRLRQQHLNAYYDADESMYQSDLSNFFRLAVQNFVIELGELLIAFRRLVGLDPPLRYTLPECLDFTLSNEAVANRERERDFEQGQVPASRLVRAVYAFSCQMLDWRFAARPIPRFWVLETVARMPYFAYSSCLHLLATLGWYRSPTLMNMHHAEELNEAYHLAVMESLGGDKRWGDRFIAFHAGIVYYWCLVLLFFISPTQSYRFSQLIESHAVDTYAQFLDENEEKLRSLPAPDVAYEYYNNFMYYFYEFQLSSAEQPGDDIRRPEINSLFDVFQNVLLDELEHSKTMEACTEYIESGKPIWYNGRSVSGSSRRPTMIPSQQRRDFWKKWSRLQSLQGEE